MTKPYRNRCANPRLDSLLAFYNKELCGFRWTECACMPPLISRKTLIARGIQASDDPQAFNALIYRRRRPGQQWLGGSNLARRLRALARFSAASADAETCDGGATPRELPPAPGGRTRFRAADPKGFAVAGPNVLPASTTPADSPAPARWAPGHGRPRQSPAAARR